MRALTILTTVAAVVATSLGVVAVSGPAGAAPDDVVLKGRVVDTSGNPLGGIVLTCDLDGRGAEDLVVGTDADGTYSVTRADLLRPDPDESSGGCEHLRFTDPYGRYVTTTWPSGDMYDPGEGVGFPPYEGGEPTVINMTLDAGGQLTGSATDVKNRGLYHVRVHVYDATTRKLVAGVRTSPYGGYRVLGLRPGKYKVKVGTGVTSIGYRPAYAGGGSTFDSAKAFTVKAGVTTAVGRRALPNTARLFTSRGAVTLTYPRPLVSGSKIMVSKSAYRSTPDGGATIFIVSRAVNPGTGEPDDTLPYASSVWNRLGASRKPPYVLCGNYGCQGILVRPFAGRRFVFVAVHTRKGYAQTSTVSAPTAVSQ